VAEDDYEGQKSFVSALVSFAAEHNVHIHLVAHSRKKDDESKPPGKLDIRGAAAITDLVHNGWSVWRNKDKEAKVQDARAKSANGTIPDTLATASCAAITCWKNRRTGVEPFRYLWLNHESMQFCDRSTANAIVYLR
jgi:twinkle protein